MHNLHCTDTHQNAYSKTEQHSGSLKAEQVELLVHMDEFLFCPFVFVDDQTYMIHVRLRPAQSNEFEFPHVDHGERALTGAHINPIGHNRTHKQTHTLTHKLSSTFPLATTGDT